MQVCMKVFEVGWDQERGQKRGAGGVDRGTRMQASAEKRGAAGTPALSEIPHQHALDFSVQQKGVWDGAGCLTCGW